MDAARQLDTEVEERGERQPPDATTSCSIAMACMASGMSATLLRSNTGEAEERDVG